MTTYNRLPLLGTLKQSIIVYPEKFKSLEVPKGSVSLLFVVNGEPVFVFADGKLMISGIEALRCPESIKIERLHSLAGSA